jgi:hypothetical protein
VEVAGVCIFTPAYGSSSLVYMLDMLAVPTAAAEQR